MREADLKKRSNPLDVREAVKKAREHILEMFADENVSNVGLEEVNFDDYDQSWLVTIGFSRPWDEPKNTLAAVARTQARRTYKIVRINSATGELISIKNREVASERVPTDS